MDLDDAYANGPHIPGADGFAPMWRTKAAAFRAAVPGALNERYGDRAREVYDLFAPQGATRGTVIFVHGGYWRSTDKDLWTHLAAGPLARGWRVAVVDYDLCPDVGIPQITQQIAAATGVIADRCPGPLRLTGHSAGGHLVARMLDPAVAGAWLGRVTGVVPISPLSDLEPFLRTSMNADFGLDAAAARAESPLYQSVPDVPVTVWVGGAERPAFLDQARWLGEAWGCPVVVRPGRHHFDIIAGLEDAGSDLTGAVVGAD
ncbi:Alpha/beta hydrolase family protein [Loktanella fryxellensis]|uniref:Alpha/beta hydrolase family protein n=1 Tax=Loktanella fryxellensis TaxID=245187 RepID=A0A1H8CTH9_9RHOB|nr:alpha/beta hydrolase [Loktanella fryxellensis]SEM98182.1 Alpha/beta hydrolase family protein [Loktanella fryxellensis]